MAFVNWVIRAFLVFCTLSGLLIFAVLVCLLALEFFTKLKFDQFCNENVGSIPSSKIVTDGVELRRGFDLMPGFWPDGLKYLEFSGARVNDGSLFENLSKPNLLSLGDYQIRHYDEIGQECLLHAEIRWGKVFATHEQATAYLGSGRCEGLAEVPFLQSEYYAEYSEVNNFDTEYFATILGRGIRGRSFRVYRRADNMLIGSLDIFSMSISKYFPKAEGIPHSYLCSTDREPPYESGLKNFFE